MRESTLVFLDNGSQILLAQKAESFGAGKWNGPGGKLDPGETKELAAVRETREEVGVIPLDLSYRGMIRFRHSYENDYWDQNCYIFVSKSWQGNPEPLVEIAKVAWFPKDSLPFNDMWPPDRHWLPLALEGWRVSATFYFDKDFNVKRVELAADILPQKPA